MNPRFTLPKLRWIIAGLLLVVTLINYTDRLTMSVLVGEIRQNLHLDETDYWQIVSLFFVAYAIMYAGSGYVVDRLGTRLGMALFVCLWSVSQMLHGLAIGKWSFAACRFGLGLAEPGSFPAATKAVGEWFPPQQRALGVGIFNAGSSIGATLASPLAAVVALNYGWRAAFVFTGVLGLLWLAAWLALYRPPRLNPWLSRKEAAELGSLGVIAEASAVETPVATKRADWLGVLASRAGFMLIVARFLTDPVIYFVIFGLPDYLEKERGFDLAMVGRYAWVPYAFGGGAYLVGGWLSGRMMRGGWSLARSRKTAMTIGAALLPTAILAPLVPSAWMAIAATCVIVAGHSIWVGNLMTLPADMFPPDEVATAAGFSGMGGAIGGALAFWFTGSIISHFSYLPIFICAGLLHPTAILLVWWLLPERYFLQKGRS
ncbi:MAG: MFS transporter [Verrucomicrobiota bacterium]|nr:MFS transporter [Verrucomicrobiota bacterium]MDE3067824.1 MFS transporter [Verrucomicrobiota bacterium]